MGADFGVLTPLRALALTVLPFPVAAVAVVEAAARLARVGVADPVAVARWRLCAACPSPVLLVGAAVVERFAAAVAAVVGLAVAATAEGAMARAGMGHRVLYRVMGRAGVVELAAGFPSHFV